jgi:hypothetical protein
LNLSLRQAWTSLPSSRFPADQAVEATPQRARAIPRRAIHKLVAKPLPVEAVRPEQRFVVEAGLLAKVEQDRATARRALRLQDRFILRTTTVALHARDERTVGAVPSSSPFRRSGFTRNAMAIAVCASSRERR